MREALQRGATVVVSDVETDERLGDDDRATFRARQIAAFVGVALFKDEQMVASFGANHHSPRVWTAAEIELVRQVAERTWDAVERTRAEAALRQQTTRLSLALQASTGGSWTWDLRTNDADWDAAFREQLGFTPEEPACSTRGWHVCTSKIVRGCPAHSSRCCRTGTGGITHIASCCPMARCDGCRVWVAPNAMRPARSRG